MDALVQVEQKYGFTLPSVYRSFVERGYVTYPGDAYLWVHEAEWLPTEDMLDHGGFGDLGSPKPGLVAFAFSGRRDLWAWQTERVSKVGEPTIVLCPRDSYEGEWYAPSFLGWLYRISLEYASSMWDEEAETKQNLGRWASVLREFGKHEWADFVEGVASRAVIVSRSGSRGQLVENSLISQQDVSGRLVAAFGPGFIDSPYIWDLEGEPAAE
ncbi:MAG: SMI1/KNR4 family protein [Zavarzinella sp.]